LARALLKAALAMFLALFSLFLINLGREWMDADAANMKAAEIAAYLNEGWEWIIFIQPDEALESAGNALALEPEGDLYAAAAHLAGRAYYQMKDYPDAEEYLRAAHSAAPDNKAYIYDLALCLADAGYLYPGGGGEKIREARSFLESLPENDYDRLYIEGRIAEREGLLEKAERLYRACYGAGGELSSKAYISAAGLAREKVLARGGDEMAALNAKLEVLEDAAESLPGGSRGQVLFELVEGYTDAGDGSSRKDERAGYFGRALKHCLTYREEAGPARHLFAKMGELYRKTGDYEESKRVLRAGEEIFGEAHDLCFLYALSEAELQGTLPREFRDLTEFTEYARRAVILGPEEFAHAEALRTIAASFDVSIE
jgi:tetratricopeptide (TPR) repeat protein